MRNVLSAALAVSAMLALGCGGARAGRPLAVGEPARLPASARSHVVVVVMENAEYGEVIASGGRVATIVAGPDVRRGARSARPVDHYGVLATIEDALGLGRLAGAADPRAGTLAGLFARPPALR